ncbi:MAG: DMT family transporter [Leptospirales bacterium]
MSSSDSYRARWGALLVILSAIGFAAKGILAKTAYREGVDPSTVLTLRMLSVFPVYLFGVFWFGRGTQFSRPPLASRDFLKILLLGLLGFDVSAVLDFEGLAKISAGMERLVLFLYPTFVVFLSALFLRKKLGTGEIFASLLAYAGIAVVTEGNHGTHPTDGSGILLVFGSALFYAVYLVGLEGLLKRVDPLWLTSVVMIVSTAAISLQSLFTGTLHFGNVDSRALSAILLMGILSTAVPTFFMTLGISMIGASRAAVLSFLGPVATLLMATVFLGERLSIEEGAGAILVLCGVASLSLGKRKVSDPVKKSGHSLPGSEQEIPVRSPYGQNQDESAQ